MISEELPTSTSVNREVGEEEPINKGNDLEKPGCSKDLPQSSSAGTPQNDKKKGKDKAEESTSKENTSESGGPQEVGRTTRSKRKKN